MKRIQNKIKLLIVMPGLLFFPACFKKKYYIATTTFTDVQSIPMGFRIGSSFFTLTGKQDNPLFAKEIDQKISMFLTEKGYFLKDVNSADYYLAFDYEVTTKQGTINVPKYVPGQMQTTTGNVCGSSGGWVQYQQKTESPGTIVCVPQECTIFISRFSVCVYDAGAYRKDKKEVLVWKGDVLNSGEDGDLRDIIDYLLVAIFKYFGMSTQKNIVIELDSDNEKVQKLRGALQQVRPTLVAERASEHNNTVKKIDVRINKNLQKNIINLGKFLGS